MYHYDPNSALDELRDDAVLPHPVHLRDMILRTKLDSTTALDSESRIPRLSDAFRRAAESGARNPGTGSGGRAESFRYRNRLRAGFRTGVFDLACFARLRRVLTLAQACLVVQKATT